MWTVNFQMFKLVLQKAEEPEIKLPTSAGSLKKQRSSRKNIYFCFIDFAKAFVWITTNWKILKENSLWKRKYQTTWPDSWEICMQVRKQVRTVHGTMDCFQIGKGVRQDCILSPCLFNLYAEYIMRNAGLDKAQVGIKIARRNINNLMCRWHHPNGRG